MKGPFFTLRGMFYLSTLLSATLDDHRVGLLVVARLEALGELAPRRARVTTAGGAAFAAAHGVIHRVHGDAAVVRPTTEPAGAARLAEVEVEVLHVAHLADGRAAVLMHLADFA